MAHGVILGGMASSPLSSPAWHNNHDNNNNNSPVLVVFLLLILARHAPPVLRFPSAVESMAGFGVVIMLVVVVVVVVVVMASPQGVVLGHGAGGWSSSIEHHHGQHQHGSFDVKFQLDNKTGRGRLLITRTLYSGSRFLANCVIVLWNEVPRLDRLRLNYVHINTISIQPRTLARSLAGHRSTIRQISLVPRLKSYLPVSSPALVVHPALPLHVPRTVEHSQLRRIPPRCCPYSAR